MVLYISISDSNNEDLPDNICVRFKSNQCIHCIHSQPDWNKTVKHIQKNYDDPNSGLVEVEAGHEHLTNLKDSDGTPFVVKGYPTYAFFKNGVLDSIYTDERTIDALTHAIVERLKLHNKVRHGVKHVNGYVSPMVHSRKKKRHSSRNVHKSRKVSKRRIHKRPSIHTSKLNSLVKLQDFDIPVEVSTPSYDMFSNEDEEPKYVPITSYKEMPSEENESIEDEPIEDESIQEDIPEPTTQEIQPVVKPFVDPFVNTPTSEYNEEELKDKTKTILKRLEEKIEKLLQQEKQKEEIINSSNTELLETNTPTLQLKGDKGSNNYTINEVNGGKRRSRKKKWNRRSSKKHK